MDTAQQTQNKRNEGSGFKFLSNSILVPSTLKPVIMLLFIFLFQQLSGGYVVIFYAVNVFRIIGGTFGAGFDEYDTLVFLGLVRFVVFYSIIPIRL
jgi:SP family facilitated glucose transporter-like MFS transporter 8